MRRLIICAAALVLGVASLAAAGGAAGDPPRAQLTNFGCRHALDPENRQVAVRAVMRPLAGTQKLALRFDLLAGRPGSPPAAVRSGDLGLWTFPKDATLGQVPGDVWKYEKTVVGLDAPATYQFRVAYRWLNGAGKVIGSAVRFSRRCAQRELRPDLQMLAPITVSPVESDPEENRYTATILNAGNSAAGPFTVLFISGDGRTVVTSHVARLGPHQPQSVSFTGPACTPATAPTLTADSAAQVDDLDRSNNALTATCPPSGSTSGSRYTQ